MAAPAEAVVSAQTFMKIKKVKVKKGQKISKGTIYCLYTSTTDTVQRLKSNDNGVVTAIYAQEGVEVDAGFVLFKVQVCSHPTVMKDMCADCGADLRVENSTAGNRKEDVSASVAMVHSIPELIVSEQQAKELGKADEERLLKTRKLVLLVDLDQTLIHTTNDNIPANLKDVHHFQLWHGNRLLWYHTRLRPETIKFLEHISQLYELHICTFGVRMYAHTIARILDPKEKYFSHRILSRDECFDSQAKTANLKALFPCGDGMVCIIDDREDVWHFSPNLVHVKPYRFFQGTADINAPPGLTKTEQDDKPLTHRVRRVSQSSTDSADNQGDKESDKAEEKAAVKSENWTVDKVKGAEEEDSENKNQDAKSDNLEKSENDKKMDDSSDDKEKTEDSNEPDSGKNSTSDDGKEVNDDAPILEEESAVKDSSVPVVESETMDVDKTEGDKDSDNVKDQTQETMDITTSTSAKQENQDQKEKDDVKVDKDGKKPENTSEEPKDPEEEMIEWDDEDDYLLYLEEILKTIHKTFYDFYDQTKAKDSDCESDKPDLKNIIPYIKKKVLKGCNIVFSGVVPTNMNAEKSRAHVVAKSLGANIQPDILYKGNEKDNTKYTTHLVAARHGTGKVRTALKYKTLKIVNPNWLWSCAERWEKVEEKLFPLAAETTDGDPDPWTVGKKSSKRKADTDDGQHKHKEKRHKGKQEDQTDSDNIDMESDEGKLSEEMDSENKENKSSESETFSMTYNPMLAFSDDDLAYMDKEVDDEIADGEDPSSEDEGARDERIRVSVLKCQDDLDISSSEDSLTCDMPRGWGIKTSPRHSSDEERKGSSSPEEMGPEYESETDQDKFEKIMDAFGPETENSDEEYQESVGSVDDEIADAVIKEFLS